MAEPGILAAKKAMEAIAKIKEDAQRKMQGHVDGLKEAIDEKRQEIKAKEKELDELLDVLSQITGKPRKASAAVERHGRIAGQRMDELLGKIKGELSKGKEYSAAEVAEAVGANSEEMKSVMVRAKREGLLVSNGKVGKAGRVKLS